MASTPTVVIVSPTPHRERRDAEAILAARTPLVHWASALREAGARAVTVVQRHPRMETLRRDGVDYVFVGEPLRVPAPLAAPLWNARAARTVAALAPDVVHVDGMVDPLVVRQLKRRLARRVPLLVQDHGGIHAGSPGFRRLTWRALHRFGLGAADGFLFTARELARPWRDAGIIDGGQAVYEISESSTRLAEIVAGGAGERLPGEPALLWVGRLDANKDPLTVLAAFERALPSLPGAALTMVFSEAPLLEDARRRIAGPALGGRVHLRGRVAHAALAPLYASADLFVLGSHHESCGFALLEALSFGVTPVVSDIPAFRALTGGRVGALAPVGDAAAFAGAIERLGRAAPGDRAERRARVRDHFSRALAWPAVGRRALEIYAAAAAQERR
jgi:glycosyltransferase involved in cell wall biosynthesis